MRKRKGVPTVAIQESLGHQTEAITQKYLSSFDNSVVDQYDKLIIGKFLNFPHVQKSFLNYKSSLNS